MEKLITCTYCKYEQRVYFSEWVKAWFCLYCGNRIKSVE